MGQIQPNIAHMRYRPDIDGLRALAIVAVVLYHCRFGVFAGGFVGVDVFFVISGYLIAALIYGPMQEGRFSFAEFWERRIRRIFPMLAIMLAVTSVFVVLILFPADLRRYASSLAASAAFVSNFEFFSEAGYFDTDAGQKPLLHTWSLGAEAQFYLVFPPVLYALRKLDRTRLLQIFGVLAAASFALSLWAVAGAPAFAFYLLPARLWELLLGVMLSIARPRAPQNALAANGLAMAGLGLIGWSVFTLSSDSSFPGAAAVPPCIGTALVIYAGLSERSLANRLLGMQPFVFVGLISYSLYLWHWPVLALARYYAFGELTVAETGIAVAFCVVLSVLSWRFIEQPVLRRTWIREPSRLMRFSAASAFVLALAGGGVGIADGLPQRFPAEIRNILAVSEERPEALALCFNPSLDSIRAGQICRIGGNADEPTFLLWGDSHAESLAPSIAGSALRRDRVGRYAARGSCPPLLGVTSSRGTGCRDFAEAVVTLAIATEIDQVFLAAYWTDYAEGASLAPGGGHVFLTDDDVVTGSIEGNHTVFRAGLERTVKALTEANIQVVLIGPVPEVAWPVPETLARITARGSDADIRTGRAAYLTRSAFVFETFQAMREKYGASLLRPDSVLCGSAKCEIVRDGHPLYRDAHHLSTHGAGLIEPIFGPAFE